MSRFITPSRALTGAVLMGASLSSNAFAMGRTMLLATASPPLPGARKRYE